MSADNPYHLDLDWHTITKIEALNLAPPIPCCENLQCEASTMEDNWYAMRGASQKQIRALARIVRHHDDTEGANCDCDNVIPFKVTLDLAVRTWSYLQSEWRRIRDEAARKATTDYQDWPL